MKQYGDITKIKGDNVPIVDIITGGSPCQDLSVAGGRAGLDGKRSGLFMEQIRIIKEMREHDRRFNGKTNDFCRLRYMVWENVCGAFSSNKGEDFRIVLQETARIAETDAIIPRLEKGQKWSYSGCVLGDRWSIAWRVHDAQFWGVPQRRKRIALVADFNGQSAPEILFERKGLSRSNIESREEREKITSDVKRGFRESSETISFLERAGKPGGGKGILIQEEKTGTLSTFQNQAVAYRRDPQIIDNTISIGNDLKSARFTTDGKTDPLMRNDYREPMKILQGALVRRITPLECERLQGYPDGWTNIGDWVDSKGKKHKDSDSSRYKALGNSIALPFWEWMAQRMVIQLKKDGRENPTMASLFDGIGGFPLVFSRSGCIPVWASEIEDFPIAVTKIRFPTG